MKEGVCPRRRKGVRRRRRRRWNEDNGMDGWRRREIHERRREGMECNLPKARGSLIFSKEHFARILSSILRATRAPKRFKMIFQSKK
jgi:hypothetical protein